MIYLQKCIRNHCIKHWILHAQELFSHFFLTLMFANQASNAWPHDHVGWHKAIMFYCLVGAISDLLLISIWQHLGTPVCWMLKSGHPPSKRKLSLLSNVFWMVPKSVTHVICTLGMIHHQPLTSVNGFTCHRLINHSY